MNKEQKKVIECRISELKDILPHLEKDIDNYHKEFEQAKTTLASARIRFTETEKEIRRLSDNN